MEEESVEYDGRAVQEWHRSASRIRVASGVAEIPERAFMGCRNLQAVDLGNVATISDRAFLGCRSLERVVWTTASAVEIGVMAFAYCNRLGEIDLRNVTKIGFGAFNNCSALTSVTIPSTVVEIERETFLGCLNSLSKVTLCEGVHHIGDDAFDHCFALRRINIPPVAFVIDIERSSCQLMRTTMPKPDGGRRKLVASKLLQYRSPCQLAQAEAKVNEILGLDQTEDEKIRRIREWFSRDETQAGGSSHAFMSEIQNEEPAEPSVACEQASGEVLDLTDSEPEIGGSAWGSSCAVTSGVRNGEPAEPASQNGVDYVLKVVKVKVEAMNEAKIAAETRAEAAERALDAANTPTKIKKRTRAQLCSLHNLPEGAIKARFLNVLLRSGTGEEVEGGECALCCESYQADSHRLRVVCSADDGCGTFAMCRLCVFRCSIMLKYPVDLDDLAGVKTVDYDPTVCPHCRKKDAFRDDDLPALPDKVRTEVEAKIWEDRDREQVAAAEHAFGDDGEGDGDYEPEE